MSVQIGLVSCITRKALLQWWVELEKKKKNQHPVDLQLYYFIHFLSDLK